MGRKQTDEAVRDDGLQAQANEKLLSALISLLALRDTTLLAELKIIFANAQRLHEGEADEIYDRVERQIGAIAQVVLRPDEDPEPCDAGTRRRH